MLFSSQVSHEPAKLSGRCRDGFVYPGFIQSGLPGWQAEWWRVCSFVIAMIGCESVAVECTIV